MAAHPETLKVIQTVHDTAYVALHDTLVRVAEPQALDRWVTLGAGLATIFTAVLALVAVRSWRHQLKGATEYKLAIRVYRGVLRLRNHINAAREPMNHWLPIYEGESFENTPDMVERERKEYWNWYREVVKSTLALKALRPEVEIHWDYEGMRHIDAMEDCAKKLRGNYKAYFQAQLHVLRGEAGWAQVVASSRKVLYNPKLADTDKDEYGDALNGTVEAARAFLRHKIDLTKLLPRRTLTARGSRRVGDRGRGTVQLPAKEASVGEKVDDQIKLYGLLVDQLTKYNAIFWQAPAVAGANFLALTNRTALGPSALFALVVFNCAMLYAFARMVVRQSEITWATEDAEEELRKMHPAFVPSFAPSGMSSRLVLVVAMLWLNGWLLDYIILQSFRSMPTRYFVIVVVLTAVVASWLSWRLWKATRRKRDSDKKPAPAE